MKGVPFLTTCSKDDMSFAGVHILGAPYKIDKEYEYFIPTEFRGKISIGAVVIVPFGGGNRHVAGIVSSVYAETALPKYKSIIGLTPGNLCIGEELYGICEFLKERCFCSIGDASKAVLPSGFSVRTSILYEYAGKEPTDEINVAAAEIVRYVSQKGEVSESELKGAFQKCIPTLKLLCTKGYLRKISRADCKVNTKSSNYVRLLLNADELYELHNFPGTTYTPKQLAAIFELEKNPFSPVDEFRELSGVSDSVLRELRKKNVVEILPIPKDRNPYADIKSENTTDFELSECQKNAFDKLQHRPQRLQCYTQYSFDHISYRRDHWYCSLQHFQQRRQHDLDELQHDRQHHRQDLQHGRQQRLHHWHHLLNDADHHRQDLLQSRNQHREDLLCHGQQARYQ